MANSMKLVVRDRLVNSLHECGLTEKSHIFANIRAGMYDEHPDSPLLINDLRSYAKRQPPGWKGIDRRRKINAVLKRVVDGDFDGG